MSLASKQPSCIWVWAHEGYHLQYEDVDATICGMYNKKPLQFAVEAYRSDFDKRCDQCMHWYEQLVLHKFTHVYL